MGDSLENTGDSSVEAQNVAIVEYGAFANYLRKAATILLPEEDAVPPALNVALEDRTNHDCILKFLSDPQVPALYLQRSCTKGALLIFLSSQAKMTSFFKLHLHKFPLMQMTNTISHRRARRRRTRSRTTSVTRSTSRIIGWRLWPSSNGVWWWRPRNRFTRK